jgi:hypothetical protein
MSFVAAMSSPDNTKVGATKVGVNGADVYTEEGVGNLHVSLFTMLNRGLSGSYIEENVGKIFEACKTSDTTTAENAIKDLFVMAFQTRDVRGGKGERKLFNNFIVALYKHRPDIVKKLVTLVPEYGCWRDMWDLYNVTDNELKRCILDVAKSVFFADLVKCSSGDVTSLSLIAKWLPREKSGTYPGLARTISNHFYSDIQSARKRIINYRLDISTVNKALKTVEINMCSKQWATIKPDAVPGRCLKIHNKAFLNEPLSRQPWKNNGLLRFPKSEDRIECREHFLQFIDGLKNGTRKAHGANVVMPHELVENSLYTSSTVEEQEIIQGQWNSIREEIVKLGGFGKCVPMCDFSGSMDGTPKLVSLALGILISEINHHSFKDHILTFDSDPKWHSFSGMITLKDKLNSIRGDIGVGLNTNFYKACMRILQKMKDNKVPVGEEPEDLIVLTDMGWDAASSTSNDAYYYSPKKNTQWATQVEQIRDAFVSAGEEIWGAGNGWKAPRIVIWNLRGDFKDFHAKAQDNGVVMLSGWSPSILKALQKGGVQMMTPLEGLRQVLDDERYDKVRDALKEFFP